MIGPSGIVMAGAGKQTVTDSNGEYTLVEGLPNEKYLFFGGMRADPRVIAAYLGT